MNFGPIGEGSRMPPRALTVCEPTSQSSSSDVKDTTAGEPAYENVYKNNINQTQTIS